MARYDYDRYDLTDRFDRDRREQERIERMIDQMRRELDYEMREDDPVMRVINDPTITMTPEQKKAINNPRKMMNSQRRLVSAGTSSILPVSAGRGPLYPNIVRGKRTRKKTKMDKTMSKCLKEANLKLRKKNGQLRKGKTMADVMKLAHRLCKKS
jgi:hypothetical protein